VEEVEERASVVVLYDARMLSSRVEVVAGMQRRLIGYENAAVIRRRGSGFAGPGRGSRRGDGCRKRQARAGALEACWGIDGERMQGSRRMMGPGRESQG
jgi:hypothetical protein